MRREDIEVGDLVKVYTGVGKQSLALAIITEIEPIQSYDGTFVCWIAFVDDNPYGSPRHLFKFSSHYLEEVTISDKNCPCK